MTTVNFDCTFAERMMHMSQRFTLTALRSALLSGEPWGGKMNFVKTQNLRLTQISLASFEAFSTPSWCTPPPPQWQRAWARGSGSWKLWGASPSSSNQSGGCSGQQTDKPPHGSSGDLEIWICPEKATSNMIIVNQINPIGLAMVQSSMACAGTQWNMPVLSYFISVFSNTRLRTRASSGVGDSFLLSWSGVRFIWNSFRLKLPVVRTATSTTVNDTHTLKTISGQRQLTLFAHASGYKSLIFNVFMAALAVKVCPENATRPQKWKVLLDFFSSIFLNLLTSPADWARKYPMVNVEARAWRGLIAIFASFSSLSFTSIATSSSFSFTKQILRKTISNQEKDS